MYKVQQRQLRFMVLRSWRKNMWRLPSQGRSDYKELRKILDAKENKKT